MPFNLNWKEILLIAVFLIGGIAIISTFNSAKETTVQSVTSNTTLPDFRATPSDNTVRDEVNPNKDEVTNSQNIEQPQTQSAAINTSSVESPLSNMKAKKEASTNRVAVTQPSTTNGLNAATTEKKQLEKLTSTKSVSTTTPKMTPATKSAIPPIKSSVVPTKAESRSAAPLVTVTPSVVKSLQTTPKNVEVSNPLSTTKSATVGNFYLIAASRNTFEEAQASFESLKNQGYNPLLLSPIKSKGINNYRIAIFRSNDRKKVEDFTTQINGKGQGYWIDQR